MRPRVFTEFVLTKACYAVDREILIQNPLNGKYKEIAESIRQSAKGFLNEKSRDASLTRIDTLIKEYDSVVSDIDNYISDNRDNWLIPHMSDITYIRPKDRSKVVGILRRESLIGKSTIHFFASPDFINLNIRQRLSKNENGPVVQIHHSGAFFMLRRAA